jgi:hypothetical protein
MWARPPLRRRHTRSRRRPSRYDQGASEVNGNMSVSQSQAVRGRRVFLPSGRTAVMPGGGHFARGRGGPYPR